MLGGDEEREQEDEERKGRAGQAVKYGWNRMEMSRVT